MNKKSNLPVNASHPISKKGISFILISLALFNFSCGKKIEQSKVVVKPSFNSVTDSEEQFQNAYFKSEEEKKFFSKFKSGREFCEKYKNITETEKGVWINVPVDYSKPDGDQTEIYAFFQNGQYDPNLPTLLFFDGGAGGNSHLFPKLSAKYNQLHFDQRGVGCSSPATLDLFRSQNYYSSKNTALDAKKILEALKLEKVSVYAISYGTVPATIFASLYPETTTAVVLEGLIFDYKTGDSSKVIHYNLKKMYKNFSEETKEAMLSYFTSEKLMFSLWSAARIYLYQDSGFFKYADILKNIFPKKDEILKRYADQLFSPDYAQGLFFEQDSISNISYVTYQMISCKEQPSANYTVSKFIASSETNEKSEFEPVQISSDEFTTCKDLGIKKDEVTYSAKDYPIAVPVTYFQGTWDGATHAKDAIQHWKKVAKGQAQLLISVKGGHSPNTNLILSNIDKLKEKQLKLFEKALTGEIIQKSEVDDVNLDIKGLKWIFTTKNLSLP